MLTPLCLKVSHNILMCYFLSHKQSNPKLLSSISVPLPGFPAFVLVFVCCWVKHMSGGRSRGVRTHIIKSSRRAHTNFCAHTANLLFRFLVDSSMHARTHTHTTQPFYTKQMGITIHKESLRIGFIYDSRGSWLYSHFVFELKGHSLVWWKNHCTYCPKRSQYWQMQSLSGFGT